MIAKIRIRSMLDARRLVSVAEKIPCNAELRCGCYTVNVRSMLGVLSLPSFEPSELHIHSDNKTLCDAVMQQLSELDLLSDGETQRRSIYDITVLGEILIDFTRQGCTQDGQLLFARNPGGAPANVAVAASRLGCRTAFLGKAGQDMHGRYLQAVLSSEGVSTKGMLLDPDYFTTLAFVDVGEDGERTFSFARKPGADTQIQKEEVDVDILDCTNIFHVGSLSLTDQPSRDTTMYALRRAKAKGSIISYDPNYRAPLWPSEETAKQQMRNVVPYADIMKLSQEEIGLLTDRKDPEEAAQALLSQGVKVVAVTLGAEGAYIRCQEGGCYVPGFQSNVVDSNGAGDSFWGGFLTMLSRSGKAPGELTLEEAAEFARYGNAAASLCVEKHGAMPAMPISSQVEKRMAFIASSPE